MNTLQTSWPRCPRADELMQTLFASFCDANPRMRAMKSRMRSHAGVALIHLIDHWVLPADDTLSCKLEEAGYEHRLTVDADPHWKHPHASLPSVRIDSDLAAPRMVIRVDDITDFVEAWDLPTIGRRGDLDSGYEEARFPLDTGELGVIVRIGYSGYRPGEISAGAMRILNGARARLQNRDCSGEACEAIDRCGKLLFEVSEEIGAERATDEFFAAERLRYMRRNRAARLQYALQQEIGIGWANQDHHTYRSSREGFVPLIALWRQLGFLARERYYAGADAGWGAQIMEHPVSRVVIFSDVDLSPEELDIDFSVSELAPRSELGTIGLWCGLHGDSIAGAGMHHLECEFDFDAVSNVLREQGVSVMPPFTDLAVLKQAFTVGEIWKVDPARVQMLLKRESITQEQAARFIESGATGSHFEILQRREGFKGFNKTGVSAIIKATDARG